MRGRLDIEDEERDWNQPPEPPSRGELSGSILAGIFLLYALVRQDVPLLFLTASFLLWQLRVLTGFLQPATALFVRNMLQGLCLALFLGAIIMLLF